MQNPTEKIAILQKEIAEKQKEVLALLKTKNETDIASQTLKDQAGNLHSLKDLMGENKQMMVIHNMGKSCVYCTLWADGFTGVFEHMKNRIPTIFVSPDDPATQKEFAESRGWNFDMYSAHESDLLKTINFQDQNGRAMPGVSIFTKEGDQVFQTARDYFGPGDKYCSVWHMFDLLEDDGTKWSPKYSYS